MNHSNHRIRSIGGSLLLLIGLSMPGRADDPRIVRVEFTALQGRQMGMQDEEVLYVDRRQFRPSYDNSDRIHLRIVLRRGPETVLGLSTPIAWNEERSIGLMKRVAGELGWTLNSIRVSTWAGSNILSGYVNAVAHPSGGLFRTRIDLTPVLAALREAGVEKAEIRIRAPGAPTLRIAPMDRRWVEANYAGHPILAVTVSTFTTFNPVVVSFGTTPTDRRRGWTYLTAVIIVPIFVLLVAELCVARSGAVFAYGAFRRTRSFLLWATLVFWLLGLLQGGIGDVLFRLIPAPSAAMRPFVIIAAMISVPFGFACMAALATYPIDRRFRQGRYSLVNHLTRNLSVPVFLALMALIVAVGFAVAPERIHQFVGGNEGRNRGPGSTITWLAILAATCFSIARILFKRLLNPEPLMSGHLFDNIYEFAGQAGVTVSGVSICRTGNRKIANGLVNSAGRVFLTDHLLDNLSSPEVDAVIAHELAHLQQDHAQKRMIGLGFCTLLWLLFAGSIGIARGWSIWTLFATSWIVPMILHATLYRRHEFEADAGAVALTGDPGVYIQMLRKLDELNVRSRTTERILRMIGTHPTIEQRIARIHASPAMSSVMNDSQLVGIE
jgi:Zn-dependent protease with chaperone function